MREVAIVGMSCRLPGGLDELGILWDSLCNKVNTAGDVPSTRWSGDWYHSSVESAPGKAYVKRANFLKQDVRDMDAGFFDLPPSVAENIDPQQRIMLEVVWEAFENAGIPLPTLAGQGVGVYVGGFMLDHMINYMNPDNAPLINQHTAAGMMMTMLSNRISHVFDLRGPSLSIDTACSSSLTAFNYGCQDVWSGACDVAVVGGVNVMTRPEYPVGMSKGQFLARDGECKSFDERGDGYGRGEGAGVVVLKEYNKAVADGDPILAKVLATGVNSDGRTPGISMPSGEAQEALAREVCVGNGIDPASIHYIECHGTGTAIGDPTEAGSIGRVYGAGRSGNSRAVIGTIKSNIGHTEAVAGISGVIKAVLTLNHRVATPLANLQTPNPDIPFEDLGLRLADDMIPLGEGDETLRAAVNSFGYGGTNAHAILESVAVMTEVKSNSTRVDDLPLMLPLSARSGKALKALANRFAGVLDSDSESLDDILNTAAHRRAHMSHRAVAMGATADELSAALKALANGDTSDAVVQNDVPFAGLDKPVFVYTGMGPQWWGMGQELYRDNEVFRNALDKADSIFSKVSGFSILAEMHKDEESSVIGKTEFAQPANFMIQYGLTELLEHYGVKPGAIVGHSVGEVGSAYAAGALTLEDALTVSYHRSRTQAQTAGTGSMLALGLGPEQLEPYLSHYNGRIDIAAVNGPSSMTVSGDTVSIHSLAEELTRAEVFNRVLTVEVPYHSHLMDPITDELISSLEGVSPKIPERMLFSTVTGEQVEDVAYDGQYWVANVRQKVAFMDAMKNLMDMGFTTFIEIGPHPVLSSSIRDCARTFGKDIRLVETLRRGTEKKPSLPEAQAIHSAVANTYTAGAAIDWNVLAPAGQFIKLPNYPWQRDRHWLETEVGRAERMRGTYPLLGYPKASAANIWRNDLTHNSVAYLYDHIVTGTAVMPAAGYIEMMLQLGHSTFDDAAGIDVRNISIAGPLLLNRARSVEVITHYDSVTSEVTISSAESGSTNKNSLHVNAEIGRIDSNLVQVNDIADLKARFGKPSDVAGLYRKLARLGLEYGPFFQAVEELHLDPLNGEALACLELDTSLQQSSEGYILHPSLLDGCFQMLMGVLRDDRTMYLPTGFRSIRVMTKQTPAKIWCFGKMVSQTAKNIETDLTLFDDAGRTVAVLKGMQATAASSRSNSQRVDKWGDPVFLEEGEYLWQVGDQLDEPSRLGRWVVIGKKDDSKLTDVVTELEDMGAMAPVQVTVGEAYEFDGDTGVIRSGNVEDVTRLFCEVGDIHGLAFMHGLSAGDDSDPTAELAIETMLSVSKALIGLAVEERPRVYYVTQSAFVADAVDTDANPAQTAISGFMRVAHNEIEGTRASLIDLPAQFDSSVVELAVAEMLADSERDEVAIRDGRRMVSSLEYTETANKPLIQMEQITADTVYRVRPGFGEDAESLVSIAELEFPACGASQIKLRVSDMSLPGSLLTETSRDTIDQSYIAVVGVIDCVGADISDMQAGKRMFGFAPADFASHLQADRNQFHLAELPESISSGDALAALDTLVLANYAATAANLDTDDRALIMQSDPIAAAIGDQLEQSGVVVTRIDAEPGELHEAVEEALSANDVAHFDAVVAPLSIWQPAIGAECLAVGGTLVDCDKTSSVTRLPASLSGLVRCDLSVAAGRPRRLKVALDSVSSSLLAGTDVENNGLSIRLQDIATQTLDIPPIDLRIDVEFNLAGEELPIEVSRPLAFDPEGSYLVTGGLGGFGMKTAAWLVAHGARSLVLASRSGANTPEKKAFVKQLNDSGITVATPLCDLGKATAVSNMIANIEKELSPLKGIYHSAAVIEDYDIADLEPEVFRRVMRSKATSALALHEASKHLQLDQFVCYSSIANVVGNRRQSAYAAANGYLAGLVRRRRNMGLSGLVILWGAIGDVGVVADSRETEEFLKYIGIRGLPSDEALDRMEAYITRDMTEVSCTLMSSWADWARYETIGAKSPRFATVLAGAADDGNSEVREQLIGELAGLDIGDRISVLSGLIAAVIASELRQDAESLSIERPINDFGIDSLMATEIQVLLGSNLGLSVSVMDLLGGATIRAITDQNLAEFGLDTIQAVAAE